MCYFKYLYFVQHAALKHPNLTSKTSRNTDRAVQHNEQLQSRTFFGISSPTTKNGSKRTSGSLFI